MDLYDYWAKALKNTQIIRPRVQGLRTLEATNVPYILLSDSSINRGDTVVRKGEVIIEKPSLVLPPLSPQWDGFDFEEAKAFEHNSFVNFLLVRGVKLPSMKYNNTTSSLDVFEGDLAKATAHFLELFERSENTTTGLLTGPEDCWQFSLMVYVCSQAVRNAERDIIQLLKEFRTGA